MAPRSDTYLPVEVLLDVLLAKVISVRAVINAHQQYSCAACRLGTWTRELSASCSWLSTLLLANKWLSNSLNAVRR